MKCTPAKLRWFPCCLMAIIAFFMGQTLLPPPALAADPIVTNVSLAQRRDGSQLVDVYYDLADADGDVQTITLLASDDGGASWIVPCRTVSGDVGPGILPGTQKHIVWDFGYDNGGWQGPGYRVRVMASDAGTDFSAHSPGNYSILSYQNVDWSDPHNIEKFSRADIIVTMAGHMWGYEPNESLHVYDQIKALNPDCKVLGYNSAKTVRLEWQFPTAPPYWHALWNRTLPYHCWTTTGDTLQDFPGNWVLNILIPECREVLISTMAEFRANSDNPLDGIFWDYFGRTLWVNPDVILEGEPDLDGDGIGHWDDPDEIAAYQAAQDSLVALAREAMGADFILLLNGSRARVDSVFAAMGDGINYELFPTLYPFNDDHNMATAMDPNYHRSIFNTRQWPSSQNGGPYIILENNRSASYYDHLGMLTPLHYGDLFRVVGLLADCYTFWNTGGTGHVYGWPTNIWSLGPPLGPTVIDGDVYTRDFRYGRIELTMESGVHPVAFDYIVWINGVIVEEFNLPDHFP